MQNSELAISQFVIDDVKLIHITVDNGDSNAMSHLTLARKRTRKKWPMGINVNLHLHVITYRALSFNGFGLQPTYLTHYQKNRIIIHSRFRGSSMKKWYRFDFASRRLTIMSLGKNSLNKTRNWKSYSSVTRYSVASVILLISLI